MGKVSKATKQFSKKHLADEIKTRKRRQKVQFREKKKWESSKTPLELAQEKEAKAKRARKGTPQIGDEDDEASRASESSDGEQGADDAYGGNVDAFLEKGFFDAMSDEDEDEDEVEADEGSEADEAGADEDGDDDDAEDSHKKDLEALKARDPEFYKYLQEHDQELLHFGEGEEGEEGEEEAEQGANRPGEGEEDEKGQAKILTLQMISSWAKELEKGDSYRALRDLVRAFESACHVDTVDDKRGAAKKAKSHKGEEDAVRFKYRIVSGQVFERLMRVCIAKMHIFVGKYLGLAGIEGMIHALLKRSW
jgi:nucleolar complex protein 2